MTTFTLSEAGRTRHAAILKQLWETYDDVSSCFGAVEDERSAANKKDLKAAVAAFNKAVDAAMAFTDSIVSASQEGAPKAWTAFDPRREKLSFDEVLLQGVAEDNDIANAFEALVEN